MIPWMRGREPKKEMKDDERISLPDSQNCYMVEIGWAIKSRWQRAGLPLAADAVVTVVKAE